MTRKVNTNVLMKMLTEACISKEKKTYSAALLLDGLEDTFQVGHIVMLEPLDVRARNLGTLLNGKVAAIITITHAPIRNVK